MAYTTTAALKTYLGISDATDDALLATLIGAAQATIDAQTGRTFEAASDTVRKFDAVDDVQGRTLYFDSDCAAVTSITNGDGTTLTAGQYTTEPRRSAPYYAVTLLSSFDGGWTWGAAPENAIQVTGKWAYSATPPADIVQVCTRLAAFYYRQKDNMGEADRSIIANGATVLPVSIPSDVRALLAPYRRMV